MIRRRVTKELEKKLYLEGIELFNEHEFFDAHEVWEDIWHMAYGAKHAFYQGMIQAAVALEHYRRSNPRGVISLHRSYQGKFAGLPARFMGLDIARFLEAMEQALAPVTSAQVVPEKGQIELDPATVPRIELLYDPFENGEAERFSRPERF